MAAHPGASIQFIADALGYKSAGSLERTLYRRKQADLIHKIKGSKSQEEISRVALSGEYRKGPADQDHPWYDRPQARGRNRSKARAKDKVS